MNLRSSLDKHWLRQQEGATAIEYALLVAMVALAIFLAVQLFGDSLSKYYSNLSSRVETSSSADQGQGKGQGQARPSPKLSPFH